MNRYLKYTFYTVVTILIAFVFVQAAKHQGEPNTAKRADNPDQRRVSSQHKSSNANASLEDSTYMDGIARLRETNFDFGYCPRRSTLYHAFHLHNVGTDTLHITRIRPG